MALEKLWEHGFQEKLREHGFQGYGDLSITCFDDAIKVVFSTWINYLFTFHTNKNVGA